MSLKQGYVEKLNSRLILNADFQKCHVDSKNQLEFQRNWDNRDKYCGGEWSKNNS